MQLLKKSGTFVLKESQTIFFAGTQSFVQNLLAYPGLGHSGPLDLDGGGSSGGECPSVCTTSGSPQVSTLPPAMRVRLYELFVQIEREFEILYAENMSLQEKVDTLTASNAPATTQSNQENFLQTTTSSTSLAQQQQQSTQLQQQQQQSHNNNLSGSMSVPITPATSTPLGLGLGLSSNKMSRALYAHKLRTHTNKLKQHTNKIMSNFKGKKACLK